MRSSSVLIVPVCLLAACATTYEEHDPYVTVIADNDTDASGVATITLPDAQYDRVPQMNSFLIENTGADIVYLTPAEPRGDEPNEGLEYLAIDLAPYTRIVPGQRLPIEATLDRRTWRWKSGDYSPTFLLEARYFFAGQAPDQAEIPSTTEAPKAKAKVLELQVNFTINCDLDEDGFDSTECDGTDCDDRFADVFPGAVEVCDGLDQDCDGAIDNEATDRTIWYYDSDRDGYGAMDEQRLACVAPGSKWVDNGDDCDDASATSYPGSGERCDGLDNNCNSVIDEGC